MIRTFLLSIQLGLPVFLFGQGRMSFLTEAHQTISLRVTAYGKKAKDALANAEQSAIKEILFRGVPGSNQIESPMLGTDEALYMKQHSKYFNELFEKGRYQTFIMSDVPVSEFAKDVTKKKSITTDIKVNLGALQADLENNQIIRKFGF
ncbi:MAG: hypothetical protein LUC45_08180 [Paraprevotella sp.]|nr:hypothetical protein [Paraprevotella sp.]